LNTTLAPLHIVYTSQLAPGYDHLVFGAICRASRARNAQRGIGGVLLFDGHRFLQWLHGSRDAVLPLMSAIAVDTRHEDVAVHYEGMPRGVAFEPAWRAGFVDAPALDRFIALRGSDEELLLAGLKRLLGQAELDPPAFP
jgi:hypothetical protein